MGKILFWQKHLVLVVFFKKNPGTKCIVVFQTLFVSLSSLILLQKPWISKKLFNKSFTSSRAEAVCFHNYFPFMMLIVRILPFLSFLDNRHDVRFAQFNYSFTERKSFVRDVCEMFGIEKHDQGLQFKTDDRW